MRGTPLRTSIQDSVVGTLNSWLAASHNSLGCRDTSHWAFLSWVHNSNRKYRCCMSSKSSGMVDTYLCPCNTGWDTYLDRSRCLQPHMGLGYTLFSWSVCRRMRHIPHRLIAMSEQPVKNSDFTVALLPATHPVFSNSRFSMLDHSTQRKMLKSWCSCYCTEII